MLNNPTHIIIQAGGRGTRLEWLTRNKPKCLVPVNNIPLIFHTLKKYPQTEFRTDAAPRRRNPPRGR